MGIIHLLLVLSSSNVGHDTLPQVGFSWLLHKLFKNMNREGDVQPCDYELYEVTNEMSIL
jgi:hypothetical protein